MVSMNPIGATRYIRHGHACLGVTGPGGLTLTASGHNNSLLWSRNPDSGTGQLHSWSPWGNGETTDGLPGFNGERPDPVSGSYHLGNGYRAYNPVLRRFNCPDNLSPFGAGGINPYAYCAGDPINHTDPTGHISWQGILGIVGGAIGLGLSMISAGASIAAAWGIAAAVSSASATSLVVGGLGIAADVTGIASGVTEEANPGASSVLGWVSMATGIAGMATGMALLTKVVKTTKFLSLDSDEMIIHDVRAQFPIKKNIHPSNNSYKHINSLNNISFSSEKHLISDVVKSEMSEVNELINQKIGDLKNRSRLFYRFGHAEDFFMEYSVPNLYRDDLNKLNADEASKYFRIQAGVNYLNKNAEFLPPLYRTTIKKLPPVPSYEMSMIPPPPLYSA